MKLWATFNDILGRSSSESCWATSSFTALALLEAFTAKRGHGGLPTADLPAYQLRPVDLKLSYQRGVAEDNPCVAAEGLQLGSYSNFQPVGVHRHSSAVPYCTLQPFPL